MQLEKKTLKELHNILTSYGSRYCDKEFVLNVADIINQDDFFRGQLNFHVTNNSLVKKTEKNRILLNPYRIRCFSEKFPACYDNFLDKTYQEMVKNVFALFYILQKSSYMSHRLGLIEDDNLAKIYQCLYQKIDSLSKKQMDTYHKEIPFLILVRNANIEAFKQLLGVTELTNLQLIPIIQYFIYLLQGYEGDFRNSPMEETFHYFNLPYSADFSKVSHLSAMEHGVESDHEYIKNALELIENYYDNKETFNSVYRKLKER